MRHKFHSPGIFRNILSNKIQYISDFGILSLVCQTEITITQQNIRYHIETPGSFKIMALKSYKKQQ